MKFRGFELGYRYLLIIGAWEENQKVIQLLGSSFYSDLIRGSEWLLTLIRIGRQGTALFVQGQPLNEKASPSLPSRPLARLKLSIQIY